MPRQRAPLKGGPPPGFRINRKLPLGRHAILTAFPGLDALETASRLEQDTTRRRALFGETSVELVSDDAWMYIAPWEIPREAGSGWEPVVTPRGKDCVVVGEAHLRESPPLILFLDIFHELCHVLQRQRGMELWDRRFSYVERPTEVEAYRFVVEEARRLHVPDAVLRDYLKVEWIDDGELARLLTTLGVPPA